MPEDARYIVVFVTAGSSEEARKIADLLLDRRKAACVNIIPGVQSSYWWKGKIECFNRKPARYQDQGFRARRGDCIGEKSP